MKNTDLINTFKNFLTEEGLTEKKIILMVSGGVDSVVLLYVAQKCVDPKKLAVFHLDHQARENSQEDFIFVQNICSKNNIKFYGESLTLATNTEANWREARRRLSQEAAADFGAERILTAHHATDLVETMVFRLSKGTGPNGLSPFNIHTKPFWKIPKSELLAYAKAEKIVWHEDPTNQDTKYRRNLIRHQVLPALRDITPNLEKAFVQESQLFDEVDQFLQKSIPPIDQPLPLKDFLALDPALQKTWLRHVSQTIPSLGEIEDCLRWLKGNPEGNTKKNIGKSQLLIRNNTIILID